MQEKLMLEESLQQIVGRWKKAFGKYDELRAAAESAAVRWEWTDGERYNLLPHFFKRYPGRGRVLKAPPTSPAYFHHYGFDNHNRVCVVRDYGYLGIDGPALLAKHRTHGVQAEDALRETFYAYDNSTAELIEFVTRSQMPIKVQQILYRADQVARYGSFSLNGYSPKYSEKGKNPDKLYDWLGYNGRMKTAEQYVYEADRLTTINEYHELPGMPPFHSQEQFTYDEAGKLQRIDQTNEDGYKQVLYQRRKKGQTFSSIREEATQKLVETIIDTLKVANIREKLYCIELSYRQVTDHFPPYICLGRESYRQRLLNSNDANAYFGIFAPVLQGKDSFLEIDDPETLELCARLEQEIQSNKNWDAATRVLRNVAAALTHHDWTNILDVTPDFVVFAIDHEMEGHDLPGVLRASASRELIKEWKKKGWLV